MCVWKHFPQVLPLTVYGTVSGARAAATTGGASPCACAVLCGRASQLALADHVMYFEGGLPSMRDVLGRIQGWGCVWTHRRWDMHMYMYTCWTHCRLQSSHRLSLGLETAAQDACLIRSADGWSKRCCDVAALLQWRPAMRQLRPVSRSTRTSVFTPPHLRFECDNNS